jgi:hypothetical protein
VVVVQVEPERVPPLGQVYLEQVAEVLLELPVYVQVI